MDYTIVHSNNISKTKMPTFDRKKKTRLSQKTTLEKFLLAFVVFLFVVLGFVLYLYLINTQRRDKVHQEQNANDGSKICMKQRCVLNAANLMEKMEPEVDPCDDFYGYACGAYDKTTPIPSHLKYIHVLQQLQDENTKSLRIIIEDPKLRAHHAKNTAVTRLFQAYDICMDYGRFEENSIPSFKKLIRSMGDSKITSKNWNKINYNVFDAILKAMRLKFNPFFKTGVWIDPANTSKHVFYISGSTLWKKYASYHSKKTPEKKKVRHLYREYMITMLKSVAANPHEVTVAVDEILKLEKRLAKNLLSRKPSDRVTFGELSNFTKFDWLSFFQNATEDVKYFPRNEDIILVEPKEAAKYILNLIRATKTHVLSNFIAWRVLQESIPALPSTFSALEQKFKNNIQSKLVEQPERWRICVEILSESFQKVLNYLYVEQKFSHESRRKAFEIFREIRREFVINLKNKTWMDNKTQSAAAEKARGIHFFVGYSDETKNIDKMNTVFQELYINRSNFFETYLNQRSFAFKNIVRKLLHPVQKNSFEDQMTSDANAYYIRQHNKILFLAGMLQRPIYDRKNIRASNYGALGMIVGHELTHAFDSNGHKFDKHGNERNWWTSDSLKHFEEKAKCFIEQYNKFTLLGEHVRGKSTLGENIADNGGLKLAFNAFKRSEKQNGKECQLPGLNLTNDQVFFLSFAQVWCSKYTKDALADNIQRRVPMMFRVTGPLRNSVEFSKAYRCPVGSKMNPVRKCGVW